MAPGLPRVSFADVLSSSLTPSTELRAWFSEERGYQQLRQTRVPLSLPKARLCYKTPPMETTQSSSASV